MIDALISDRLEFVKLLLEKGLQLQNFLTPFRIEYLYNLASILPPSNEMISSATALGMKSLF